jgi:TctA family transporter
MKMDGLTAVALVLIASFAIDRIVTAVLFLASFAGILREPGPGDAHAEKMHKLIYFVLAGVLGVVVLAYFGNVRILRAMGLPDPNPVIDAIVTGLLLMGGAERLSGLIQPGATEKPDPKPIPIEVTGTLTNEDRAGKLSGTVVSK